MPRAVVAVSLAALSVLAAASAGASSVGALEGSWAVAHATTNAESRLNSKMLNSTWTFRGTELVVHSVHGEYMRSAVSFDASAQPPAFLVTPFGSSEQRPFWVIWARQHDELRVAFYDGAGGRPEDFGPRRASSWC